MCVSLDVRLPPALGRALDSWLARVPPLDRAIRLRLYRHNVRRLNDVLAATPLAGRYWVWGGLLLGWAREGAPLAHDARDADFVISSRDESLLRQSIGALQRAGFRLHYTFRNNDGQATEYVFARHGIKFEFFLLFPDPVAGFGRYFAYASERWLNAPLQREDGTLKVRDRGNPQGSAASSRLVQLEGLMPDQPLESFRFLGRRWLKPANHQQFLESCYGNWRIPDPGWSYTADPRFVATCPWTCNEIPPGWT